MRLSDVVKEIALRCPGLNDEAKAAAFLSDLRACGCEDGPALQGAFDEWRKTWTKRFAPQAAEFAQHYRPPEKHYTQAERELPDPRKWAATVIKTYPEGRFCADNGLLWDLWKFCTAHPGKLPGEDEMREWAACHARMKAGELPSWPVDMRALWADMRARHDKLAQWRIT